MIRVSRSHDERLISAGVNLCCFAQTAPHVGAKKAPPSAGDMKRRGRLSLGFRAGIWGTDMIDQSAEAAIVPDRMDVDMCAGFRSQLASKFYRLAMT